MLDTKSDTIIQFACDSKIFIGRMLLTNLWGTFHLPNKTGFESVQSPGAWRDTKEIPAKRRKGNQVPLNPVLIVHPAAWVFIDVTHGCVSVVNTDENSTKTCLSYDEELA